MAGGGCGGLMEDVEREGRRPIFAFIWRRREGGGDQEREAERRERKRASNRLVMVFCE